MEPLNTDNLALVDRPERLVFRALGYELVARGELPSLRLGRRLVVPRVALLALVGATETAS